MIDVKITPDGDIAVEGVSHDVGLTGYTVPVSDNDLARCLAQLARMALSTEKGDLLIAPSLGNELHTIVGLPNKPATAVRGERLIRAALQGYGINNKITIESWPDGKNVIAYEVSIAIGNSESDVSFIVKQALDAIEE